MPFKKYKSNTPLGARQSFQASQHNEVFDAVDALRSRYELIPEAEESAPSPHGVATLTADLVVTDPATDAALTNYRPESGTAPDPALAAATNPHSLEATAGAEVDVALLAGDWVVVAIRGSGGSAATLHGVATLSGALLTSDVDASISGYRPESGVAPDPAITSAANVHGLEGASGDECDVAYLGGAWTLVAVRCGGGNPHGVATLSADMTTSSTAALENYRPESGEAPAPALAAAENPHNLEAVSGADVDVAFLGGQWVIVAVRGGGSGGDPFTIEMDSRGTLAVRVRSAGYTSAWSTVPTVACADSGYVEEPAAEPT